MSPLWVWLGLLACIFLSALYSGSETGFYSLSRGRLEADEREGRRRASLVRWLVRDERALLIAILVGNNLMLELTTSVGESLLAGGGQLPGASRELLLTAFLTPLVFLFGEVLPKDLFRRRPHSLLGAAAPLLAVSRVVFLPLTLPLRGLSVVVERLFRLDASGLGTALGRDFAVDLLDDGERHGTLGPQARALAHNALTLSGRELRQVMVPWERVEWLDAGAPLEERRAALLASGHSRLLVVGAVSGAASGGGEVAGYLHQLELLGGLWERSRGAGGALQGPEAPAGPGAGLSEADFTDQLRPILCFEPGETLSRALARMRTRGQRLALVGTRAAPVGIVTLKDLVEEISGELADW